MFTAFFMPVGRKENTMAETNYTVITCFDGSGDATDAFTDVIARKIARRGKIIPFPKNDENTLENERANSYNDAEVIDLNRASGLCG